MSTEHYDVIIIGTGAGGGTLAHMLAPSGKQILLLERGGYLPREPENWDSREVFRKQRYLDDELWYDKDGVAYKPHQQYFVGGNTKFYGAILFRLRERDFQEVRHYGGTSPAWPISYQDLEPYYAHAERLYLVHGQAGEDPAEPPRSEADGRRGRPPPNARRSSSRIRSPIHNLKRPPRRKLAETGGDPATPTEPPPQNRNTPSNPHQTSTRRLQSHKFRT